MIMKSKKTKPKNISLKQEGGYMAIISALIVSALMVIIASSANIKSIYESDMALKASKGWESFYLAMACAEEALIKLKENVDYLGGEVLTLDNGECTIVDVAGAGNNRRTVKASASLNDQVRRIEVNIDEVNPTLVIDSWQEVSSF
jgi:hypothetical protein